MLCEGKAMSAHHRRSEYPTFFGIVMLEAKRTGYRNTHSRYLRITPEGCINLSDFVLMSKQPTEAHKLEVIGRPEIRNFVRCSYKNRELLVDAVTGSIYDAITGESTSPLLKIVFKKKRNK